MRSFLRATASTVALVTIYYLLPLDHPSTWAAVTILVIGLALLTGLVTFQVRSIVRLRFPALRAIEALATSVPVFLLLFASAHAVLSTISARNFGQPQPRACRGKAKTPKMGLEITAGTRAPGASSAPTAVLGMLIEPCRGVATHSSRRIVI